MARIGCMLLGAVLIGTVAGQCPTVPINFPAKPLDTQRAVGLWYEYHHQDNYPYTPYNAANDPTDYNLSLNATIIGAFPSPSGGPISYYSTWLYSSLDATTSACNGMWQQGNFTSDGRRQVMFQFATTPGMDAITNVTYVNLFTDYNLVQVLYRCNKPNADGKKCDEPYTWVHTRVKPPLLTTFQKQYIEAVANYYITPIACGQYKFADMMPSKWDLTKTTPCNAALDQPPMSAAFKALFPKGQTFFPSS
ncbi:uncharacterized protein LOC129600655 [Paramacrobiotus metropolitanus]|uniref:uncharacterized protein LOC129600655 n=1 Tax=Paramacrobiotus metropolitanus TaxID=2943436 RepID=UPI0024463F36|nr:uncharacterized protein LOC129600655 [Paramacrobiotus metropolitanus]